MTTIVPELNSDSMLQSINEGILKEYSSQAEKKDLDLCVKKIVKESLSKVETSILPTISVSSSLFI